MLCLLDWLQGRWSWPPLESDPAVFLALARDLLIGGGAAADGSGQALPPLQQELLGSLPPLPHFGEVLSFDEDGPNALCESRALLVCFHSAPSGRPGLHPAQAAAAAASAADAGGQVFFIRQVPGLDAACGIIALLHALLNAGLLGAPGGTVAGHWPEGGPMRRWLEALPPSASPADRGRALVNDVGIRAIYRTHATGGQSRMPLSPIWTWVTLLPALAWVVSAAWVLFARGTKVLSIYLCFSLACLLVCALIWRLSGGRCPSKLECHFVCLAEREGRLLLLDGLQDSAKDLGACEGAFARSALEFVRGSLLPALSRPDTCAIVAVSEAEAFS